MCDFSWTSVYQDLDPKQLRDQNYRAEEAVVCQELQEELAGTVEKIGNDVRAGWALRFYLAWYSAKISYKFQTLQQGSTFHWGIIAHILQATWLFFGSLFVPYRLREWGAIVRLLPTHIRAVGIYVALFSSWAITNELFMRTTEDQLLALWIPTTSYMVVNETPQWQNLREEEWFVWGNVGATCLFVFFVSLRRSIFNGFLMLFFCSKKTDPEFGNSLTQAHRRVLLAGNKVLNLIDEHQFVATYHEMIWQPSKLSVNLSIRNSFLKEDIGDLLGALALQTEAANGQWSMKSMYAGVREWLSGGQYPRGPKLFLAFLAGLVLAFAIGPFFDFEFVMASAVPWGLRCLLRIGAAALSPNQSTGDVAKIFAIVVAMGVTDFPYSIALVATNFKIFDDIVARWLLMALVTVLVLTVSDAIAPLILMLAEKMGWVDRPMLRPRPESGLRSISL